MTPLRNDKKMTSPLETIRRKKFTGKKSPPAQPTSAAGNPASPADSCLPPCDRLPPAQPTAAASDWKPITPPPSADPASPTAPPVPSPDALPPSPCPTCGCPVAWLDAAPLSPAKPTLADHAHCGACRPPPTLAIVRRWLMVVLVEGAGAVGREGGGGSRVADRASGGNAWQWEGFRPRFNLARRGPRSMKSQ